MVFSWFDHFQMALTEFREKTYSDWPFKKGKCTAKEMAKAGFYVTEKDETVTCYFCSKELEGWEENDDPFQEHKKHAPYCHFVKMFDKAPKSVTLHQLFQLEIAKGERLWEDEIKRKKESFQEVVDNILNRSSRSTKKRVTRRK